MKKVLIIATITRHIQKFHSSFIEQLNQLGYIVDIASKGDEIVEGVRMKHNIDISRNPFKLSSIKAIFELRRIIKKERYDIIHCHTPMGGVIGRLASIKLRKNNPKVIYTAHGFHFCKGSSILSWILYYPVEKFLSHFTDVLILINQEDYNLAKKYMRAKSIEFINGVGLDLTEFNTKQVDKKSLRCNNGIDDDKYVLIYVAELSYRKHQDILIKAVEILKNDYPNILLLLVGDGSYEKKYKKMINKYKLDNHVIMTGYRKDVTQLMRLSDLAISSSRREGLPVNIMEAMAIGLPIIASDSRGNRDLVKDGFNGILVSVDKVQEYIKKISEIIDNKHDIETYLNNSREIIDKFEIGLINHQLAEIYQRYTANE